MTERNPTAAAVTTKVTMMEIAIEVPSMEDSSLVEEDSGPWDTDMHSPGSFRSARLLLTSVGKEAFEVQELKRKN